MKDLTIAIGADHAGYELKTKILEWLEPQVKLIKNLGTDSGESVEGRCAIMARVGFRID